MPGAHVPSSQHPSQCDPGRDYPVCVEWRGDSPVEYWSEDDPEEPEPFSLAEVNRELAALSWAEE